MYFVITTIRGSLNFWPRKPSRRYCGPGKNNRWNYIGETSSCKGRTHGPPCMLMYSAGVPHTRETSTLILHFLKGLSIYFDTVLFRDPLLVFHTHLRSFLPLSKTIKRDLSKLSSLVKRREIFLPSSRHLTSIPFSYDNCDASLSLEIMTKTFYDTPNICLTDNFCKDSQVCKAKKNHLPKTRKFLKTFL